MVFQKRQQFQDWYPQDPNAFLQLPILYPNLKRYQAKQPADRNLRLDCLPVFTLLADFCTVTHRAEQKQKNQQKQKPQNYAEKN
jgi:hypothetical protein